VGSRFPARGAVIVKCERRKPAGRSIRSGGDRLPSTALYPVIGTLRITIDGEAVAEAAGSPVRIAAPVSRMLPPRSRRAPSSRAARTRASGGRMGAVQRGVQYPAAAPRACPVAFSLSHASLPARRGPCTAAWFLLAAR